MYLSPAPLCINNLTMSSLPLQAAQSNGLQPSSSNYGLAYFPKATVTPSRSLAFAA